MSLKILVYPLDTNPYQELLYGHISGEIEVCFLNDIFQSRTLNTLSILPRVIFYRIRGFKIVHFHWIYKFIIGGNDKFSKTISRYFFEFVLVTIRVIGYKLVWTAHNTLPHISVFDNDVLARIRLVSKCNHVFLHSNHTLYELKKIGVKIKNYSVHPIGNFIGYYPNSITKKSARQFLGISDNLFVYMYFGKIETSKGADLLVKEISDLMLKDSILILVGVCRDIKTLTLIRSSNKVIHINKFISNSEIQNYLNATDVMVHPFRKVTTSSSVMLSMSFGKPIVYPLIGNLKDIPNNVGFSYKNSDINGLRKALVKAYNFNNMELKSKHAYEYAVAHSWDTIAMSTLKIYRFLVRPV